MYAPGLPDKNAKTSIPRAENATWQLNLQDHMADRAGYHVDLRLSPPGSQKAYSWALPKGMPGTGQKHLAVRQPDHCFTPNTEIRTQKGLTKIKNIKKGDLVYSYNIESGDIELKPVTAVYKNKIFKNMKITSLLGKNGGKVRTTPGHKFLTNEGYIQAYDIDVKRHKPIMKYLGYSEDIEKVVKGILLGDGNLHIGGNRIRITHGEKQKDYLDFLYDLFKPYNPTKLKDGKTITIPGWGDELDNLYDENRKKRITRKWLEEMGTLGLAYLFLDDGSFSGKSIEISTQSYYLEDIKIFVKWLEDTYGVHPKIYESGHDSRWNKEDPSPEWKRYRVRMTRISDVKKILNEIAPYLPNIETSRRKLESDILTLNFECLACKEVVRGLGKYCDECVLEDAKKYEGPTSYQRSESRITQSKIVYDRFRCWPKEIKGISNLSPIYRYGGIIEKLGEYLIDPLPKFRTMCGKFSHKSEISYYKHGKYYYDLEVADNHNYILYNGQVVSNSSDYMGWSGIIEDGYGKGKVKSTFLGDVDILKAGDNKIEFNLYPGRDTERYILLKGNGDDWMIYNYTPTAESKIYKDVPDYKHSYKSIEAESLNPETKRNDEAWAPKFDGAHNLVVLRPNKRPDVFSYRKSKRGPERIDHTFKTNLYKKTSPRELGNTIVRAEFFIPGTTGNETSRILNSSVWGSRELQRTGRPLEIKAFDIARFKGKNVEDRPYREKIEMLREISQAMPELQIPRLAYDPHEKKQLLSRIMGGKDPETDEGIIVYKLNEPRPYKVKKTEDHDAQIIGTFEASPGSKYEGKGIGGFIALPEGSSTPIKIGTGLTDDMRFEAYNNPDNFIGEWATIKSQRVNKSGMHQAPSLRTIRAEKYINKTAVHVDTLIKGVKAGKYKILKPKNSFIANTSGPHAITKYTPSQIEKFKMNAIQKAKSMGSPETEYMPMITKRVDDLKKSNNKNHRNTIVTPKNRKESTDKAIKRGLDTKIQDPKTSKGINAITLAHERDEIIAAKKGHKSMRHLGHSSVGVILREHNNIVTLKGGGNTRKVITDLRNRPGKEADQLRFLTDDNFQYGISPRVSRKYIKNVERLAEEFR